MSWSIILANYPKSILDNDKPVSILALIERQGLTTEDELSKSINVTRHEFKKALFDLHVNQLVEYNSNFVKLTVRGKTLIDRLELDDLILNDVLENISIKGERRKSCETFLRLYRNEAFHSYQNSLCSIRVWKKLVQDLPSKETEKELNDAFKAGVQVLLYRDISSWIEKTKDYRYLIDWKDIEGYKADKFVPGNLKAFISSEESNVGQFASDYLDAIFSQKDKRKIFKKKKTRENLFKSLFVIFSTYQASCERDIWFDNLVEAANSLPSTKRFRSEKTYIKKLWKALNDLTENGLGENKIPNSWFDSSHDVATSLIEKETFIGLILKANSINELSKISGMAVDLLEKLLQEINQKCCLLLSNTKTNSKEISDKSD